MPYIVKTIGEKITLGILITKSGQGIGGLSPTIEIRRNADDKYLDFSAGAPPFWISTGGTPTHVLSETTWCTGNYTWVFDQGYYDNTKNEYTVIYKNDPPYRTLLTETISFDNTVALDVSFIRRMLANYQTLTFLTPAHYRHEVLDDAKVDTIYKADITINPTGTVETRNPV